MRVNYLYNFAAIRSAVSTERDRRVLGRPLAPDPRVRFNVNSRYSSIDQLGRNLHSSLHTPSHLALKIFQSKIFHERRKKKKFQMAAIPKLSAIHQCPFAISLRVRPLRPSQNFVDLAQKIKKKLLDRYISTISKSSI